MLKCRLKKTKMASPGWSETRTPSSVNNPSTARLHASSPSRWHLAETIFTQKKKIQWILRHMSHPPIWSQNIQRHPSLRNGAKYIQIKQLKTACNAAVDPFVNHQRRDCNLTPMQWISFSIPLAAPQVRRGTCLLKHLLLLTASLWVIHLLKTQAVKMGFIIAPSPCRGPSRT